VLTGGRRLGAGWDDCRQPADRDDPPRADRYAVIALTAADRKHLLGYDRGQRGLGRRHPLVTSTGTWFHLGVLVFRRTELDNLVEIARTPSEDMRGRFTRLFDRQELHTVGWCWPVAHVNLSETIRMGTVRGLHYQLPPSAEAKLVTCVRGTIWDVAVDIRRGSPTFLKWCARRLSQESLNSMLIPPGFAHGFQALCDDVTVVYVHSSEYSPADERGIDGTDDRLGIRWPLPVSHRSDRDLSFPRLDVCFAGVAI